MTLQMALQLIEKICSLVEKIGRMPATPQKFELMRQAIRLINTANACLQRLLQAY